MSTESASLMGAAAGAGADDLERYREASLALEATQSEIEDLEQTQAFEVFQKQLGLLRKRLLNSPQSLRQMFIDDGMQAIVWEFKQDELGRDFIKTLWSLLLRDDDMSAVLLRFIWNVPLKFKRKFIAAIDAHLSDRYPMFKGLSQGWPGQNGIPPYIRSPEERAKDFELVNQGYLGYTTLGYSAREVDLLVWLETLRDKQCEDRACELGVPRPGHEPKGGCPVKIHIPEMLRLLGTGKFSRGAGTDRELQSAAGRHRPRLPAGTAMPGRLHPDRTADRNRPARMVPARAREAREDQPGGRTPEGFCQPLGEGREAADRGDRLRSRRPHQRVSPGGRGLSRHHLRGLP